jgi:hypothetical protein
MAFAYNGMRSLLLNVCATEPCLLEHFPIYKFCRSLSSLSRTDLQRQFENNYFPVRLTTTLESITRYKKSTMYGLRSHICHSAATQTFPMIAMTKAAHIAFNLRPSGPLGANSLICIVSVGSELRS